MIDMLQSKILQTPWVHVSVCCFDLHSGDEQFFRKMGSLKKFKRVASVVKVMASAFWDCEGVLMIDFLQKGHASKF